VSQAPCLVEDMAGDTCLAASCGSFVMGWFPGLLTAPSWQSGARLAWGGALAPRHHPLPPELWRTGAAPRPPCSRVSVFRGGPWYHARGRVWAGSRRHAAQCPPAEAPSVLEVDDTTPPKAGRPLDGVACDRHGAGAARQA
jgi:hypothetical protein